MSKYNVVEAANYKFNKFLNENTGQYGGESTGYGEFDRDILDMPNQLDNFQEPLEDYSKMFRR